MSYIIAISDALITHTTREAARAAAEELGPKERPYVIYEVRAVDIVTPVTGLTNDDVPPPTGGTPVLMRQAA